MAYPQASAITLTTRQQTILKQIANCPTSPQCLVKRVRLLFSAAEGTNNTQISQQLHLSRGTVRQWRSRWVSASSKLVAAETAGINDKELKLVIELVLTDLKRPGTPVTFSTEQVIQIVALACESPEDAEHPPRTWTPKELADEAIKRGIVDRISPRSVGRFLKRYYPTT